MILYVNGDSHAAGTDALFSYGWAEDDSQFQDKGKNPHPYNEKVSFGAVLSELLGCQRINQSQAGGSNPRIIRVSKQWIESNPKLLKDTFMLIQWSTWEREEWLHKREWYQVNAAGRDHVPAELEQRYRQYIIDIDYDAWTRNSHDNIWQFHQYLNQKGIRHLFFNGNSTFSDLKDFSSPDCRDWNNCYLGPYDRELSYNSVLLTNGFAHVQAKSGHFDKVAHCFWANYVLQYIKDNKLLGHHEIPTD